MYSETDSKKKIDPNLKIEIIYLLDKNKISYWSVPWHTLRYYQR